MSQEMVTKRVLVKDSGHGTDVVVKKTKIMAKDSGKGVDAVPLRKK